MNQPLDSVVSLTETAATQIKEMLAKEAGASARPLRVYVEAGGCSGMQYGMQFDEPRDGDLRAEQFGVAVVVDPISADFVRGSIVDYSDSLVGGGFKITNPNARHSCGCGKSFEA